MAVAIQAPQRRDDLAQIAQAVNIASSIFGIARAVKADEMAERQLGQQQKMLEMKEAADVRAGEQAAKAEAAKFGALNVPLTEAQLAEQQQMRGGLPLPSIKPALAPPGVETEGVAAFVPAEEISRVQQARKAEVAARKAEMKAAGENDFQQAKALRNEYDKASQTSEESLVAFNKVEAAASTPQPSGASDMALLFNFMKSIDPGSVVRESEFKAASETQPIPERVAQLREKVLRGELLSPEQRKRIVEQSQRALQSQLEIQKNIDDRFSGLAQKFGIERAKVLDDRFASAMERFGELQRSAEYIPLGRQPQGGAGVAIGAPARPSFDNMSDDQALDAILGR